jgi:hypothetical protein
MVTPENRSPSKGCTPAPGKADCGSQESDGILQPEVWEKVKSHPCYSEQAHHHFARMLVAVAPACNIQCNYCNRKYDCANESRPGVVSERLTPEEAAQKVLAVAEAMPQLSVVGVAGPGDPLANPAKTFKTFELIASQAPGIKLCLQPADLPCRKRSTPSRTTRSTTSPSTASIPNRREDLSVDLLQSPAHHRRRGNENPH